MARKFIDLSRTLDPGVGEPNGHPKTLIEEFQTHETHNRSNACLTYSIHCGTHLDAPYHFYETGMKVDELSIDKFFGKGVLVDVENTVQEAMPISLDQIFSISKLNNYEDNDLQNIVVLIHTGWGRRFGTESYYSKNPFLSNEAAKWFADKGIKAIGLDFPPDKKQGADVHKILLGAEVCIIENLTNMEKLKHKNFELLYFPIKIRGQGGGPVRIVAEVKEDNED